MILSILEELKNEPKTNEKIAILEKYKNDPVLKKVLKYSTDQMYQSGIKQIPSIDTSFSTESSRTLDEALDELEKFYKGILTGHNARDHLIDILQSLEPNDREVIIRVITKKLDCGMQGKSINKVLGKNFICIEPYMRCSLTTRDTLKNITSFDDMGYAVSEIKMDGQYLNHSVLGDNCISTSRNGKVFDFLDTKNDDMINLRKIVQTLDSRFESGVVFMGECLVLDDEGNILPRTTGNGIIQKATEGTITLEEAERVVFVLWDLVPYDAFCEGVWNVQRKERRELIVNSLKKLNSNFVRCIDYKIVNSVKEALLYNKEVIGLKYEGTVLKCEHGIWKSHTSPKQLKMKLKFEVDLKIIGFNISSNGKRKGLVGSIQCQSSDGLINVNVGTGIKEKDNEWTFQSITENMEYLTGKILTITTSGIVQDKKTLAYSLFLPAFVEFRFDKDSCDSFERIREIEESYTDTILIELLEK